MVNQWVANHLTDRGYEQDKSRDAMTKKKKRALQGPDKF